MALQHLKDGAPIAGRCRGVASYVFTHALVVVSLDVAVKSLPLMIANESLRV